VIQNLVVPDYHFAPDGKYVKKEKKIQKISCNFREGMLKYYSAWGSSFAGPIAPIGGGVWFAEYQVR
jgi:hypothetical protein